MDGSFVVLDFPDDPSTVYIEQSGSSLFVEDPDQMVHYETVYDLVHASALSVDDSTAWMAARIETL